MQFLVAKFGGRAAWLCLLFILTHCGPPRRIEWQLLAPEFTDSWKHAGMTEEGKVVIQDNEIIIHPGQPMTGTRFESWSTAALPLTRYAIEYEAMREEGNDFFGTVTFPVNDTHVSLVIGGWGGTLVGISSIDDMDASENTTHGEGRFENMRWHPVRIEVRDDDIRAWISGKLFVNVSTKGHKLGLRSGEIEKCKPFGFSSYATKSRIRRVTVRKL